MVVVARERIGEKMSVLVGTDAPAVRAWRHGYACAVTFVLLGCIAGRSAAQTSAPHWVGAWMASPCAPDDAEPRKAQYQLNNETVRQVVHLSVGGVGLRLRFSNTFGTVPLVVRSVHVAPALKGGAISAEQNKPALFGGKMETSIPPGGSLMSDSVDLPGVANADLAVSFLVPEEVEAPAIHYTALQTSYVAAGDQTSALAMTGAHTITLDLILTGVDVASRTSRGTIVALGSSTTDGAHSTSDANHRWTDYLAERLRTSDGPAAPGVLNAGISGNKVLHDGRGAWGPIFGQSALARFHRDVLEQSGLKWILVFEGGNDIRIGADDAQSITAEQLIAGFQSMAREAHARRLKLIVATITGSELNNPEHETPAWDATRVEVNRWIRTSKDIDGFADFDAAVRDPQHLARLLPSLDSGDHLHMNDAGYKAMADSIDLKLFQ